MACLRADPCYQYGPNECGQHENCQWYTKEDGGDGGSDNQWTTVSGSDTAITKTGGDGW